MTKAERKAAYAALMKFYPLTLDNLDGEEWKQIVGYEDYHVSNFGRVKSLKKSKARILKPALSGNNYLQVVLCQETKTKNFSVHRLVAMAFMPNPENKPQVNHRDGCKLNNCFENLEWVTPFENTNHAFEFGLSKSSEDRPDAKLTNKQVVYIRENPDGLTIKELAGKFNVALNTICDVQRGKHYKTAGGTIRGKMQSGLPRLPSNIRKQIRAEFIKRDRQFGARALGRKYGVNSSTILNILKEGDDND